MTDQRISLRELRERPSRYDVDAEDHESVPVSVDELNSLVEAVEAAQAWYAVQGDDGLDDNWRLRDALAHFKDYA